MQDPPIVKITTNLQRERLAMFVSDEMSNEYETMLAEEHIESGTIKILCIDDIIHNVNYRSFDTRDIEMAIWHATKREGVNEGMSPLDVLNYGRYDLSIRYPMYDNVNEAEVEAFSNMIEDFKDMLSAYTPYGTYYNYYFLGWHSALYEEGRYYIVVLVNE